MLSSDAGILVLREVEQRLGVAERLAGCIDDPRVPEQVVHSLAAERIRSASGFGWTASTSRPSHP
jgi:hypothetical protein